MNGNALDLITEKLRRIDMPLDTLAQMSPTGTSNVAEVNDCANTKVRLLGNTASDVIEVTWRHPT